MQSPHAWCHETKPLIHLNYWVFYVNQSLFSAQLIRSLVCQYPVEAACNTAPVLRNGLQRHTQGMFDPGEGDLIPPIHTNFPPMPMLSRSSIPRASKEPHCLRGKGAHPSLAPAKPDMTFAQQKVMYVAFGKRQWACRPDGSHSLATSTSRLCGAEPQLRDRRLFKTNSHSLREPSFLESGSSVS